MKKLFYLASPSFTQVDLGILHILAESFEVTYGIIMPPKDSNFSESFLKAYCRKHRIKFECFHFTRRQRDIRMATEFFKVLKTIKKSKPDVIYTPSFDNPIYSILSLILDRKKTIVYVHDVEFHSSYPYSSFLSFGRKVTTSYFNIFHVFSKNQKKLFTKKYPTKKVLCIPLNLGDFEGKNVVKFEEMQNYEKISFLFFGKILPYKGVDLLLKTANNLAHRYTNFEITIAGRCDNWDSVYEPLIKDNGKIKKLIRRIDNDEIPIIFNRSHYLVLPYRDATQSGPLMLAYNYNVPVIASNIEAFSDTVSDGKSGFLFDRSTSKGLETVMEAAIQRKKIDYILLKKELETYVDSNFATKVIAKKYKEMFLEAIENNNK